jgi:hypothetical protein
MESSSVSPADPKGTWASGPAAADRRLDLGVGRRDDLRSRA